jgi:hypothetical protein
MFHYTHFAQSPLEFPQCVLPLSEPLDGDTCANLQLRTTELLRRCSIYIHYPSGSVIVLTREKGSFSIPLENAYILQDVITRSGLYMEGVFDGSTLLEHIREHRDELMISDGANGNGKLEAIVPLLPIFIAWKRKYGEVVHHVDFSNSKYKTTLRQLAAEQGVEFVLAQRTVAMNGSAAISRVIVISGVDEAVRKALRRRIDKDHPLDKRILRYLKRSISQGTRQGNDTNGTGNGDKNYGIAAAIAPKPKPRRVRRGVA